VHARVPGEDAGGAVSLVHDAVEHQRAPDCTDSLQFERADRRIVEHAVALAAIAKGVVCPAGQVDAHAAGIERSARGSERGPRRATRALHHLLGPRESDAALLLLAQIPRYHATKV